MTQQRIELGALAFPCRCGRWMKVYKDDKRARGWLRAECVCGKFADVLLDSVMLMKRSTIRKWIMQWWYSDNSGHGVLPYVLTDKEKQLFEVALEFLQPAVEVKFVEIIELPDTSEQVSLGGEKDEKRKA